MRAMLLERFGEPLVEARLPTPEPGRDEVVVRVERAGVCGTDVKIWRGLLPDTPLPLVPGHENAGVVAAVGEGVAGIAEGDRVVTFHHLFCGVCDRCRNGSENLCRSLRGRIGFDHAGGFAEYVAAPARNVVPIPGEIPFEEAFDDQDADATSWRAIVRIAGVERGQRVAVVGAGGLGLSACQIAAARGASVLAIDVSAEKLAPAATLGMEVATVADALERTRALPDGGADVVLDCAGTPGALELAPTLLAPGGRLVQVGYTPGTALGALSSEVALRELEIHGCRAASRADLREALDAVASDTVVPLVADVLGLDEAQLAIERLVSGRVSGRQVLAIG